MSVEKINVEITGKDAGASQAIKSVQGSMVSLGGMAKTAGAIFAGLKIVDFFKDAAKEAIEGERVSKVFEHAIRDIAGATAEQAQALRDKASALQAVGVVEDDAILQGQAQLATFAMSTEAIDALSGAMADFAVNQNNGVVGIEQMNDAANIFGKLMSGNTSAIGQLQKTGIVFTEAQKNVLAYGTEMEKAAAVQEVMAANLKLTNETMAGTTEGAMLRATNAWNGFKQSVGDLMMPMIAMIIEFAVKLVDAMQGGLDKLTSMWGSNWGGIRSTVEAVVLWFQDEAMPIISLFFDNIAILAAAFNVIWTPIWEGIKLIVKIAWDEMVMILKLAWAVFSGIITAGAALLHGDWQGAWDAIKQIFIDAWNAMKDFVYAIIGDIIGFVDGLVGKISGAIDKLKEMIGLTGKAQANPATVGVIGKTMAYLTHKATGGTVQGGTPYMVGENGPEMFMPTMSGSIIPNNKLGGGATFIVNVSGDLYGDGFDKIFEKAVKKFGLHTKFA